MTKEEHINFWLKTAEHDLAAMQKIFDSGSYDWSLFVGHLAIEKLLKALWVKKNQDNNPPRIHNLVKIYEESNSSFLDEDEFTFLNEVTSFNIEGRYPETKLAFYKLCTKEFSKSKIVKIKKLFECILKEI